MALPPLEVDSPDDSPAAKIKRFSFQLAVIMTVLAAIPFLIGLIAQNPAHQYLGYQTAVDDHMVYAAWMRQAMDGAFLFDNRFTTDPQPALTIHLYYLVLGWVAKVVGISFASNLARLAFTFLFVILLGKLVLRLGLNVYSGKLAMILACLGGGIGFLQWQNFGRELVQKGGIIGTLTGGWAPIDVWQPEAFVFPSMLINGLFMAALCLFVTILIVAIDAKETWKRVALGAFAFLVLMNIHSYDVLLLGLIFVTWRVALAFHKLGSAKWDIRVVAMVAGVLPPAAWFLYVLSADKVFQARAATPTHSATFAQLLFGIFPLVVLALLNLVPKVKESRRQMAGLIGVVAFIVILFVLARGANPGEYFVGPAGFVAMLIAAVALTVLCTENHPGKSLLWAWALVGLVALYFPALFQRKLAMAIVIPWGILAAGGAATFLERMERSTRNLVSGLGLIIICTPSLYWFQRELWYIRNDVSSTTRHSVFLSRDTAEIVKLLNTMPGKKSVIAFSGVPTPGEEEGSFIHPYVPDLNPILSGLGGAYTYAGHWSETPAYDEKMRKMNGIFLSQVPDSARLELIKEIQPDYIIAPQPEIFDQVPFADLKSLGPIVYQGDHFALIDVRNLR